MFSNNVFFSPTSWPLSAPIQDADPIFDDPLFKQKNRQSISDFSPMNAALVKKQRDDNQTID
ncbi:MAG: hypothetical protein ACJAVV_002093 [Alphaproteobacteria bacterium]|jgi:hypothetical protein